MKYEECRQWLKDGMTVRILQGTGSLRNHIGEVMEVYKTCGIKCNKCSDRWDALGSDDHLEILTNPDGTPWCMDCDIGNDHRCKFANVTEKKQCGCLCHVDAQWLCNCSCGSMVVHENKQRPFQVGDRVRITKEHDGNAKAGLFGVVDEIITKDLLRIQFPSGFPGWGEGHRMYGIPITKLELIAESIYEQVKRQDDEHWDVVCQKLMSDAVNMYNGMDNIKLISGTPAKKGFMNNVIEKIKNFKLSAEDRILRAEGLEDENGTQTGSARSMMIDELVEGHWATRRLEIAKDLLAIKAEDKK